VKDLIKGAYHHKALDERRSRELVNRVRKLRWIGSEDEAKLLERALRDGQAGDCVLATFVDTD
jgi:hypothetical protein